MHDLTIDTIILMIASGSSTVGSEDDCRRLLETMRDVGKVHLVLDIGGKIEGEYAAKMREQTFGREFVRQMATNSKVHYVEVPKGNAWQPLRRKLSRAHFDSGDQPFVCAAVASWDKTIVTADDDYSPEVLKILDKRAGVKVTADVKAVIDFCANPG